MKLAKLEQYLLKTLNPEHIRYSDTRANGLQIDGGIKVNKIAVGVDASLEFMKKAKKWGADTLIVHHGLSFHSIENSIPDITLLKRLKFLFENKLSLFGFHYLLDYHPELGNNSQMLSKLGILPKEPFGEHDGDYWGWMSNLDKATPLEDIFKTTQKLFKNNSNIYRFGKSLVKSIGVASGSGSLSVFEAKKSGIDLVITGEVSKSTQEICRELGVNLIWGGHYITETFGVMALGKRIQKELNLEVKFIDIPNLI